VATGTSTEKTVEPETDKEPGQFCTMLSHTNAVQ